MVSFLIKWLINIIALFVVIHTMSGVSAADSNVVIVAALIIGLLNAFVKPVLILLTLPLNVFSLGLFTLVINAFLFYLASKFVMGFSVAGFWSAFWAALLFSAISFVLSLVFSPGISLKANISGAGYGHDRKNYNDAIDVEAKVMDKAKEDRIE